MAKNSKDPFEPPFDYDPHYFRSDSVLRDLDQCWHDPKTARRFGYLLVPGASPTPPGDIQRTQSFLSFLNSMSDEDKLAILDALSLLEVLFSEDGCLTEVSSVSEDWPFLEAIDVLDALCSMKFKHVKHAVRLFQALPVKENQPVWKGLTVTDDQPIRKGLTVTENQPGPEDVSVHPSTGQVDPAPAAGADFPDLVEAIMEKFGLNKRSAKKYLKSEERLLALFVKTVFEKNRDLLEEWLYPGQKKKRGRPHRDPVLMMTLLFHQINLNISFVKMEDRMDSCDNIKIAFQMGNRGPVEAPCLKTMYSFADRVVESGKLEDICNLLRDAWIDKFGRSTNVFRIDTFAVRSFMAKLNRKQLLFRVIKNCLRESQKKGLFFTDLPEDMLRKYGIIDKKKGTFPQGAKRSKTPTEYECANHMAFLIHFAKGKPAFMKMKTFQMLLRCFGDQCVFVEKKKSKVFGKTIPGVKLIPGVAASSLQNPSDPDATYYKKVDVPSHKVWMLESVPGIPADGKVKGLSFVMAVKWMTAHEHDSKAMLPGVKTLLAAGIKSGKILADSAFKGQLLYEIVKRMGFIIQSPLYPRGRDTRPSKIGLDSFERDSRGAITACPQGRKAVTTVRDVGDSLKFRAVFNRDRCVRCRIYKNDDCPVVVGRKGAVLSYDLLDIGLAMRLTEQSKEAFVIEYKPRAGIEGSGQKLKKGAQFYLDRLRFRGRERIELVLMLGGQILNFKRIRDYLGRVDKNWWMKTDYELECR
jgi:hypothetical protein